MQNQIQNPNNLDPSTTTSNDDFLEQILSNNILNNNSCSWSDLKPRDFINETTPFIPDNGCFHGFNESSVNLAAKLRQTQIGNTGNDHAKLMLQQPLMIGNIDASLPPFKSLSQGGDDPLQTLYNGITAGSIHALNASQQQINHSQNFRSPAGTLISQPPVASGGGGMAAPPKQRVRARRGQATDPHSVAERLRRMRISERMKALQELVPNTNKTDKATMLDEIIDYVKFLQVQVKVLSMSRLGGAAAVAPLVADITSEGDQRNNTTGSIGGAMTNDNQTSSSNDSLTVTEQQVAKLMEEDMGSAMQYLQGKGLCLMPISLASAIPTSTCHNRPAVTNNNGNVTYRNHLIQLNREGPTSPNMSVLTFQSAGNCEPDGSI